jgi:hypothetical protein
MSKRATAPWSPKETDAMDRAPEGGHYFFHRIRVGTAPACTLCIRREKQGHLVVFSVVPDEGETTPIPVKEYKDILNEFDCLIAGPAVEEFKGMSAMGISQYRLDDYFSPNTVKLLEAFYHSANQGDFGSHPYDQERWMNFLLSAYDDGHNENCDIFGYCLRNTNWWPEEGIRRLVTEYDFAMRLLRQSGRQQN